MATNRSPSWFLSCIPSIKPHLEFRSDHCPTYNKPVHPHLHLRFQTIAANLRQMMKFQTHRLNRRTGEMLFFIFVDFITDRCRLTNRILLQTCVKPVWAAKTQYWKNRRLMLISFNIWEDSFSNFGVLESSGNNLELAALLCWDAYLKLSPTQPLQWG